MHSERWKRAARCAMPAPELFQPFLGPLERLGFTYCITGSVAASVYGEPRLTADVDVILLLRRQDLPALRGAFPETDYYVPPEYVVLRKLEYLREGGSDKHVRDIRFIRAATPLDESFLQQEIALRGLDPQWRRVTNE